MPPTTDLLRGLKRRAVLRLRGHPDLQRLVGQGLVLGEGTHISERVYFDQLHPWLITIGDHVTLAPNVAIITHDASLGHHTAMTRIGRVSIGDRVNVGVGAIILPGTTIGEDSVVAAGAVVHGEVPPLSLVAGNPAKVSSVKPLVGFQRAKAKRAPTWPDEGWTVFTGITAERKAEQRKALADGSSGYVPAEPAPGSPWTVANEGG